MDGFYAHRFKTICSEKLKNFSTQNISGTFCFDFGDTQLGVWNHWAPKRKFQAPLIPQVSNIWKAQLVSSSPKTEKWGQVEVR